jgi:hypothetical protein
MRLKAIAVAAALIQATSQACGADIYTWVDEAGRVYYRRHVPEEYRDKARKLEGEEADCEVLRRKWHESWECFNPYRTRRGVRPEAFQHCTDIVQPEC